MSENTPLVSPAGETYTATSRTEINDLVYSQGYRFYSPDAERAHRARAGNLDPPPGGGHAARDEPAPVVHVLESPAGQVEATRDEDHAESLLAAGYVYVDHEEVAAEGTAS